jgi:homoserine O-succinyltransferase
VLRNAVNSSTAAPAAPTGASLDIALINNMPDKAVEATERQFIGLLAAASRGTLVRVRRFSLPGVPRSDWGRGLMRPSYADIAELWGARYDGVIVTGTEPRATDLAQEPYWGALTRVIDWSEREAVSAVWSCLATHAAVQHLDGIVRRALPAKRFGVFSFDKRRDHALTNDMSGPLAVPHSRHNDLAEDELAACGYEILSSSAAAGVDTFVRRGRRLSIFLQGHPEYDADTLLREYRRDLARFVRGERDVCPDIPQGLLDPAEHARLAAFRERAVRERSPALITQFPTITIAARAREAWRANAIKLYANWLALLHHDKMARTQPVRGRVTA